MLGDDRSGRPDEVAEDQAQNERGQQPVDRRVRDGEQQSGDPDGRPAPQRTQSRQDDAPEEELLADGRRERRRRAAPPTAAWVESPSISRRSSALTSASGGGAIRMSRPAIAEPRTCTTIDDRHRPLRANWATATGRCLCAEYPRPNTATSAGSRKNPYCVTRRAVSMPALFDGQARVERQHQGDGERRERRGGRRDAACSAAPARGRGASTPAHRAGSARGRTPAPRA